MASADSEGLSIWRDHHLKKGGGLSARSGVWTETLERAYPRLPFFWLDTEESEAECSWLAADQLR